MTTTILRILFTLFLAIMLLVVSAWLGSFTVSKDDGLAGGAIIFWYAVGGFVAGIVIGLIVPRYLTEKALRVATLILGLSVIVTLAILTTRFQQSQQAVESTKPPPQTTKPTDN